jgi:hypothetical protein
MYLQFFGNNYINFEKLFKKVEERRNCGGRKRMYGK